MSERDEINDLLLANQREIEQCVRRGQQARYHLLLHSQCGQADQLAGLAGTERGNKFQDAVDALQEEARNAGRLLARREELRTQLKAARD